MRHIVLGAIKSSETLFIGKKYMVFLDNMSPTAGACQVQLIFISNNSPLSARFRRQYNALQQYDRPP